MKPEIKKVVDKMIGEVGEYGDEHLTPEEVPASQFGAYVESVRLRGYMSDGELSDTEFDLGMIFDFAKDAKLAEYMFKVTMSNGEEAIALVDSPGGRPSREAVARLVSDQWDKDFRGEGVGIY